MSLDPDLVRRTSVAQYLDLMEGRNWPEPLMRPLPYNVVPAIRTMRWRIPPIEEMVEGELREVTNRLNYWQANLRRWHAWNQIATPLEEQARWSMEWEWVEPVAFYCMFQPTASLDLFLFAATNALHQADMARKPDAEDRLQGDPKGPGKAAKPLMRPQKREQLQALCTPWNAGSAFMVALNALDDEQHRARTKDFRNRASHAIAPRFTIGHTNTVRRIVGPADRLTPQANGTYTLETVEDQLQVSYSFGGLEPLSMDEAWADNLAQFGHAKAAFDAYIALLHEVTTTLS